MSKLNIGFNNTGEINISFSLEGISGLDSIQDIARSTAR